MRWLTWFLFAVTDWSKNIPDADSPFDPKKYSALVSFYKIWGPYMHHRLGIITDVYGAIGNSVIHGLYNTCLAVEKVFNAMFGVLGWSETAITSGALNPIYTTISIIGWAMLALSLVVLVYMSMGHAVSWGKVLPNVIMVALTITVLPLFMQQVNRIAQAAEQDVSSISINGSKKASSLAVQPIENNVIDLGYIAGHGWSADPEQADSKDNKLNSLNTDSKIDELDLTDTMTKSMLKLMIRQQDGTGWWSQAKNFFSSWKSTSWPATPFNYELNSNNNGNGQMSISKLKLTANGLGNANDDTYARYYVHWVLLIGQYFVLSLVLIFAAFRVVKDIFELTAMNLIAPILAYQSVQSGKKMRDLIMSIVGLYTSIVLLMVVIKMYMVFVAVVPKIDAITSLTPFQQGLATILIYAGGGFAMFSGVSYFERVTGVTQGFSQSAGQVGTVAAGGAMAGGLAGAAVGKAAGAGMSLAGKGASGLRNMFSSGNNNLNHNSNGGPGGVNSAVKNATNNEATGGVNGATAGGVADKASNGENGSTGANGQNGGTATDANENGNVDPNQPNGVDQSNDSRTPGNGGDGTTGADGQDADNPNLDSNQGDGVNDQPDDQQPTGDDTSADDDTSYDGGDYDGNNSNGIEDTTPDTDNDQGVTQPDTDTGNSDSSSDTQAPDAGDANGIQQSDDQPAGEDPNSTDAEKPNDAKGLTESDQDNPNGNSNGTSEGGVNNGDQPSESLQEHGDKKEEQTPPPTFRQWAGKGTKAVGRKAVNEVKTAPKHVENAGHKVFNLSNQYLQGRGFNVGSGNVRGVESHRFDDE